jgi:3'-phosphoadenosine 5'-phosphosulfate sulfotransferase
LPRKPGLLFASASGHATTEAYWMLELDRARHSAKELTKTHERQVKEWRAAVVSVKGERDKVCEALVETRAELKGATALCARLITGQAIVEDQATFGLSVASQ